MTWILSSKEWFQILVSCLPYLIALLFCSYLLFGASEILGSIALGITIVLTCFAIYVCLDSYFIYKGAGKQHTGVGYGFGAAYLRFIARMIRQFGDEGTDSRRGVRGDRDRR